jgi:hypothetical protein
MPGVSLVLANIYIKTVVEKVPNGHT